MEKTKERTISKVKTSDGRYGTPVTTTLSAVYEKLRSGDNEERVKKIARNKSFSSGTWRLNIPRSFKKVGE